MWSFKIMRYNKDLTQKRLKEVLQYNGESGAFSRVSRNGRLGTICVQGYLVIQIDGVIYKAHRLAWLYTYGDWPREQIDHIDRDRMNNKILNLRDATAKDNSQNRTMSKNNKSGVNGVYWNKKMGKWHAQIRGETGNEHIGYFGNLIEAREARVAVQTDRGYSPLHGQAA